MELILQKSIHSSIKYRKIELQKETIIIKNRDEKSTKNICVVYGAGMNLMLINKFIVVVEYYSSVNMMINQTIYSFGLQIKGGKYAKMCNILFKLAFLFG